MRKHYKEHHADQWMRDRLRNRNPKAIREKARHLGLTESWTKEKEDLVIQRYPDEGASASLMKDLGVSARALAHKAHRLKITFKHRGAGPRNKTYKGYEGISGTFWYQIRRSASDRDIPFLLSIQDLWQLYVDQDGKCAMTGQPLYFAMDTHNRATATLSLDRKDSSKAYERGNVQWVCKDINWMKQDYTNEEFIEWCKKVSAHRVGQ